MKRVYLFVFIAIIIAGCSAPKNLVSYSDKARQAVISGNLSEALDAWQQHFSQHDVETISGNEFAEAAKTAFSAKNQKLALTWFDQARYKNYADAEMYAALATIYQQQKNISKELDALEYFYQYFNKETSYINSRLFEIYYEIENYGKAYEMWNKLDSIQAADPVFLNVFFTINEKLYNTTICDSLSLVILKIEPENKGALEWNAKKYYWAGQHRYNHEMEKYNLNKTTRQYKILLQELDFVTSDFKKALPYLNKLWEMNPGKEYAGYLANIYARFGDEVKANYYKKYLE